MITFRRALTPVVVLAVGLSLAVPAQAQSRHHHMSMRTARVHLKGWATTNSKLKARASIEGWTRITEHKWGTFYVPKFKVERVCDPTRQRCGQARVVVHWWMGKDHHWHASGLPRTANKPGEHWYNPFSWDWKHIMSVAWNKIFKKCLAGAGLTFGPEVASVTIVNVLARGARLAPGPYGYAAVAISGCIAALLT